MCIIFYLKTKLRCCSPPIHYKHEVIFVGHRLSRRKLILLNIVCCTVITLCILYTIYTYYKGYWGKFEKLYSTYIWHLYVLLVHTLHGWYISNASKIDIIGAMVHSPGPNKWCLIKYIVNNCFCILTKTD